MESTAHGGRESETLAHEAGLAVYQCGHGLLHLRVNRVTLTLDPEEFSRLAALVGEASIRLGVRAAVRTCAAHQGNR